MPEDLDRLNRTVFGDPEAEEKKRQDGDHRRLEDVEDTVSGREEIIEWANMLRSVLAFALRVGLLPAAILGAVAALVRFLSGGGP